MCEPWSGNMPRFQPRSSVGGLQEAADAVSLSLSLFLFLSLKSIETFFDPLPVDLPAQFPGPIGMNAQSHV